MNKNYEIEICAWTYWFSEDKSRVHARSAQTFSTTDDHELSFFLMQMQDNQTENCDGMDQEKNIFL